jgi:hypothetical protein
VASWPSRWPAVDFVFKLGVFPLSLGCCPGNGNKVHNREQGSKKGVKQNRREGEGDNERAGAQIDLTF